MTKKMNSKLERYLMETMFEKSLFSDISLSFLHPSYPFVMRYNVHKSIISQSPYLCNLLENMNNIPDANDVPNQQEGITSLTIDLSKALTNCGFVLAPFQHIVRRKWQKTSHSRTESNPLLSCHIRFALQWMYCLNKLEFINTMQDKDTLRILSVSVLFDLHDLTQACVQRYTTDQLSLISIMRDLETICQLPRGHSSYLQLRDASLLLLFRFGPENATRLAMLPVDYMADVLCSDLLFVRCEFERYCLLRAVLMSFMQSVGKITWTPKGPVDQDSKRLSGFVKPIQKQLKPIITGSTVRSRKRKRIPSEDLEEPILHTPHLNRLSFTALVPFEKLVADASSGGVIDKATVLSYLLKTTVNYSNMSFDQLTNVRQDGIVDEGIVFRALWQREALERVLFPLTYHQQTQEQVPITQKSIIKDGDRSAALNEYFDVDESDAQENRRRLLLGTPRFRFSTSIFISSPSEENGWICQEIEPIENALSNMELSVFDDDDNNNDKEDAESSDGSIWALSDNEEVNELEIGSNTITKKKSSILAQPYKIYQKTFYSESETILGISYRVQIEAQVMPRHRFMIQDEQNNNNNEEDEEDLCLDENIIVCRFELQRDKKQISLPQITIKKEGKSVVESEKKNDEGIREKTKIHYWIYCLNRHEGILENDRIDPEDRVFVAVTEQSERENGEPGEMNPGYVGQVLIDADLKKGTTIDTTVALEIFGFQKI